MTLGMGELRQLCGFSSKIQISFDHQKKGKAKQAYHQDRQQQLFKNWYWSGVQLSVGNGKLKVGSKKWKLKI